MSEVADDKPDDLWRRVDLSNDPHLVIGKRRGRRIEAVRMEVHEDLFEEMRDVCKSAIDQVLSTRRRRYEPYAELEPGEEHFALTNEEISTRDGGVQVPGPRDGGGAALFEALQNPGEMYVIDRDRFLRFNPVFYAVACQQSGSTWASFIRKTNPRQFFKTGRRWWQYGDTLKRVSTEPEFVFEEQVDIIIWQKNLVSFSTSALKTLFTDVGLVKSDVPRYVAEASALIQEEVPLSRRSSDALNALGKRRVSVANRLYGLAARITALKEQGVLTSDRYRAVTQDDERASRLLDSDGMFDFDEENAEVFLDVIEGRYFEDDWTGSPRRADRFSRRG